jgi:REP-associated tyrosine transposase
VARRRPPRLPGAEYRGAVRIFFTMCTFKRQRLFGSDAIVSRVLDQLLHMARRHDTEIIAYCFMPDHLHFLSAGTDPRSDAIPFALGFRRQTAYQYRQATGGRLWQDGYFDRTLRSEDQTSSVVSYILRNPVRAGLCRVPEEHPFAGSARYAIAELAEHVQWRPY